jgi:glutathione transport system ATP-binding protein
MIYQDPMTTLNPVFTAGEQIAEAVAASQRARAAAMARAIGCWAGRHPDRLAAPRPSHQLSGGVTAARGDCYGIGVHQSC